MNLHLLDWLIIAAYIIATLALGFWIAKRASLSLRSYFLGGNEIPWYLLGVSNASGMFDISGTMWLVYLLFIYGLKSIWIPWLWPIFNQIFLMIFLSVWLRRSGVMTGAEWIRFRFGEGRGAQLAHIIVVVFAIVNVIGFLAYGFVGVGKFAATFLPWHLSANPAVNTNLWGLVITAITTVYVVKGGMFSVVFTEVLQAALKTAACIWVGIIAMQRVTPQMLAAVVPAGWHSPWFGKTLDLDWSQLMPAANTRIAADGWTMFSAFFMMTLFKGLLLSGAGPAPNYDMQRVLSTKSPRDAARMSGLVSLVLMTPRYMLVAGLTVLALAFFSPQLNGMGNAVDFELILPYVMKNFIPTGLLGLLIAALLAAFMATYSATVNAAPAYIVNDIYKRYINPSAEQKTYVRLSYVVSVVVVLIGTGIGLFVGSVNEIVQWILSALYGGYAAANLLKWYWWRFNAYGYFWGMTGGIAGAGLVPRLLPNVTPIFAFPIILAISLIGCIAGSLLTAPDDEEVLKNFYDKVRPWGFWGPIHEKLARERQELEANTEFWRDMFNVAVGIVWQTSQVALGIYLVIKNWQAVSICAGLIIVTSGILKVTWYDKLHDYPSDLARVQDTSPAGAIALTPVQA
ncbi:MAG: sodium:solute symporter family protein [bacterium]